jgi:hypothetical protein
VSSCQQPVALSGANLWTLAAVTGSSTPAVEERPFLFFILVIVGITAWEAQSQLNSRSAVFLRVFLEATCCRSAAVST